MLFSLLWHSSKERDLTDNARWLIANHRRSEAIEILAKLRGDLSEQDSKIVSEVEQLDAIVESSQHKRNTYFNIFAGGRYSGSLHLGRRAAMGAALQTIQQWTGILAIVSCLHAWRLTDCADMFLGDLG